MDTGAYVQTDNKDMAVIAAIAQTFTTMAMQMIADTSGAVSWQEVCFAMGVAMKSQAELQVVMNSVPRDVALADLRYTFEQAMSQQVVAKPFSNRADLEAWKREKGIRDEDMPAGVDLTPRPTH